MIGATITERLQRVLFEASEDARRLQAPAVLPEHLFTALLNQTEGVAAALLARCEVDCPALRSALRAALPRSSVHTPRQLKIPLSPEAAAVLLGAEAVVRDLETEAVGGEHLLLALLQTPSERWVPILLRHRLTLAAAQRQLLDLFLLDRPAAWGPQPGHG